MDGSEVRLVLPVRARLGEGLHWDHRLQRLWMVDIHGRRVLRWALDAPDWQEWRLDQRVGWVIPEAATDRVLLGLQGGFAIAPADDPCAHHWIAQPFSGRDDLRLNDAKADAVGAVWGGSLNNEDESRADGRLFRLAPDGTLTTVDEGYTVANGPAISPDGRVLLHTDSGRRTVYAFDLDAKAGSLTRKRVWRQFAEADGYPDGMTFDAEGCVWIAHWGTGCVGRYAPSGERLRTVRLPVPLVTNVCFAGGSVDRLFVTTAHPGAADSAGSDNEHPGALYEVLRPGVVGMPSMSFGTTASRAID